MTTEEIDNQFKLLSEEMTKRGDTFIIAVRFKDEPNSVCASISGNIEELVNTFLSSLEDTAELKKCFLMALAYDDFQSSLLKSEPPMTEQ